MRPDIVFPASIWHELRHHLLRVTPQNPHPNEELAYLFVSSNVSPFGFRLLVREMLPAAPSDFLSQGTGRLRLKPEFVQKAIARSDKEGWSLIEVHSHPSDTSFYTTFSDIDWEYDKGMMPPYSLLLGKTFRFASMVVGQKGIDAHFYDPEANAIIPFEDITIVGDSEHSSLYHIPTTSSQKIPSLLSSAKYHRQMLFFGQETQQILAHTTVTIVGLGGLGSFVALELAHLGIGCLILVDADTVEETNLNRLIGVGASEIGKEKVAVFADFLRRINSSLHVVPLPQSLLTPQAVDYVKGADIIVGCVDNHGARLVLNDIAIRYLIPYIDGGSGIRLADTKRKLAVGGQVQVVLPGTQCLICTDTINLAQATKGVKSQKWQEYDKAHGYGTDEIAPSVISLNGVIGSLQVTELLYILAGHVLEKQKPPLRVYDALNGEILSIALEQAQDCGVCGAEGLTAYGDLASIRLADFLPIPATLPPLQQEEGEKHVKANTRQSGVEEKTTGKEEE